MDAVTLAAANAAARTRILAVGARQGRRIPIGSRAALLPTGQSNGTDTAGQSRIQHTALVDCSSIVLRYSNAWDNTSGSGLEVAGPNAYTVQAALEYPSGTFYPLTWNGATTATVNGGTVVDSDPLGIDIPAGATFYTRSMATVTSGGVFPRGNAAIINGTEGWESGTSLTNKVNGGSIAGIGNNTAIFGPSAILGYPPKVVPSVAILGDSIAAGSGDYINAVGFISRALDAASMSYQRITCPAERGDTFATQSKRNIRGLFLNHGSTDMVSEYGVNDYAAGVTVAALQATLVTIWQLANRRGARAWQTTITPRSTSTDSWTTTGGQTVNSNNANRAAVNDWLRDGAPLTSAANLTAVATGTVGALRAGQTGHPLSGYFEVADVAETARNSGIWKVPGVTGTGNTTSGSATVSITAGGPFTAGLVPVSSGNLPGNDHINAITGGGTSGGTLSLQVNASATTTGAAITTAYTGDGLHPSSAMHALMAAAINTAKFTV